MMRFPDMIRAALRKQYARTMREAYAFARRSAASTAATDVLDCGSGSGHERLATFGNRPDEFGFGYTGLEWDRDEVEAGRSAGLDIIQVDLNGPLPVDSASQDCVIAYSILEHLLMPCSFIAECHRILRPGGRFVVLTPNISTYFTAIQVLLGRMPSSGPHPDSNRLVEAESAGQLSDIVHDNLGGATPQHRHLVVFSLLALRKFLSMSGFSIDAEKGFGYYPFPMVLQPFFELVDTRHCHQLVLCCTKRS